MAALDHLKALRALEASVRRGSFRAAADELGVTPAAVGQQVRKLEAVLGRQLLVRHANGFKPTRDAERAAAKLASGFGDLREALAMLSRTGTRNRLFMTVTPTLAERWLAPRLSGFLARHPAVDLRIDSTPYVLYRASPDFDFALRYDRPGASGHDEIALFHETLIPVCTPPIASRIDPPRGPDCLKDVPLIDVDRSTDDPSWLHWEEWGDTFGYEIPERQSRLHIRYTTMAFHALYDGHGLHLAQLSLVLDDLRSGRLVAPFGTSRCVSPGYPYSLVSLGDDPRKPLLCAFRDWVAEEGTRTRSEMDRYLNEQVDRPRNRA